jgi:alpha-galactosidase
MLGTSIGKAEEQGVFCAERQLVAAPLLANVTGGAAAFSTSSSLQPEPPSHAAPPPAKGVSLTPPMGFNSWNFYHCNIDERAIKQIALTLKSSGLAAKGYRYVNIDDCWQVERLPNGTIVPDPARFPSGMRALSDYVHSQGLKFGLVSTHSLLLICERCGLP